MQTKNDGKSFVPTRLTLVAMLLASMLMLMGGAAVAPALPLINEAFPGQDFAVSLVITLPSLAVGLLGLVIGSLADKFGKVRTLCAALVLFTIIVPPQVIYAPTYLSYKSFDFFGLGQIGRLFTGEPFTVNILNTGFSLYLPALLGVGIRSGLFIYIFRQFYRGLPHELEDAAYIDGCGFFRTFFRVILPNASAALLTYVAGVGPALLTVFLFSIVWYWNDYYYIAMYFSSTKTVSMALSLLPDALATNQATQSLSGDPYLIGTRLQAGALLAITPLLILYLFLQRYFTQGFERTGLTG